MDDRLHDGELVTDEGLVRSLLAGSVPMETGDRLSRAGLLGTSNVLWRVERSRGDDHVVRLPRTDSAARSLVTELSVLAQLAERDLPVGVPAIRHIGEPIGRYPFPWAVLDWLDGVDAWTDRVALASESDALARSLADSVTTIGNLRGIDAPARRSGGRGGPLGPLLGQLDRWLDDPAWAAPDHVDVAAIRRIAAAARELVDTAVEPVFVHGDLMPSNLLVRAGQLAAVIDWGAAAIADPAQDLAPAWAVLDARGRRVFRDAVEADDTTWMRAMAFELEHAVGAVLYYRPRGHPLADVMDRTLGRILADAADGPK